LRLLGCLAAVVTTAGFSVVCAERAWEFWCLAIGLSGLWGTYLVLCWRRPAALLLPVSLAVGLAVFALVAEHLLLLERLLGFRISNKLDLSPRLVAQAMRHPQAMRPIDYVVSYSFEQYGTDPLFYRYTPGSRYRHQYDYPNVGEIYETIVDDIGFLNADRNYYTRHDRIEVFLTGDSVLQGIGVPGVIEELKTLVPYTIYSLATAGYSPRQRVQALREFALPKQPRWLVIEFYAGNDASEVIEDELCERLQRDYHCRFDTTAMARGFSQDSEYASMADFGDWSPLMEGLRTIRSDSLTLALGTGIARKVRHTVAAFAGKQNVGYGFGRSLNGEAIVLPGLTHYPIFPGRHLDWIKKGLDLTLQTYESLRIAVGPRGARMVLLYNPTSYEIYREVLPDEQLDPLADEISHVQRQTLEQYANDKGLAFCDLTEGFRTKVREGVRGLFGHYDGTHWSPKGTRVAAGLIVDCLAHLGR
jgi:hypothetical protein